MSMYGKNHYQKKKKKVDKKKEKQQQQNGGLTCFLSASLKKNKNIQLKRFFPEQSDAILRVNSVSHSRVEGLLATPRITIVPF